MPPLPDCNPTPMEVDEQNNRDENTNCAEECSNRTTQVSHDPTPMEVDETSEKARHYQPTLSATVLRPLPVAMNSGKEYSTK